MKRLLRRLSIYGDFWLRYLHWGTRHCPWFLEPVFIFGFSFMFWLILGRVRRTIARNLTVLLSGTSPWMNQLRSFRVFWNFAWTMVDVTHVRQGEPCIRWEICGRRHLDELEKRDGGAVLLTAHMGSYDVAAPLFAQNIHRTIHLVRTPERERESQDFEKEKRASLLSGNFVIHYNEPGSMLGVTLARAISEGGIVAVQGDRVLLDVSPMTVPFREGVDWKLPRGPFMLALVAKTVIHPVFIIRMGWRRYRIIAEPAISLPHHDRDGREKVLAGAALQWTGTIRRIAEAHWRQWFVLEDMFIPAQTQRDAASFPRQTDNPSHEVESVIPAAPGRSLYTVFTWAVLAGGWTSAVVLRRLLEWAVGDTWHVAAALLGWPLVWFLLMVMTTQTVLWVALLLQKTLRVPECGYDALAGGVTLATFGGAAWSEMRGGCPVGWWLGLLGFIGIGAGLLQALIPRTEPG